MKGETAIVLLAVLFGTNALSADPECVDLSGEPPVYQGCQLKADSRTVEFTFCSPYLDVDGDPMPQGSFKTCAIQLDEVIVVVEVTDPGQLFASQATAKNPGHIISAWCTNADDIKGEVWTSDVCFPARQTKVPYLVR